MDDFVRKPFRFNEIYECLSKQLGLRFIYEGVAELTEDVVVLTPDMLLALAEELRSELGRRRRVWKVGIEGGRHSARRVVRSKAAKGIGQACRKLRLPDHPESTSG